MRILLDEDLPRRLGSLLVGHDVSTVPRCGWAGVKNGKLLALAASNRIEHLSPLVPNILREINLISPKTLRRVSS